MTVLAGSTALAQSNYSGPDTGASATWNSAASWTPSGIPNAVGAQVTFANNPSAANRVVTVDSGATGFTVGSISFTLATTNSFTNAINTGTSGSKLIFDNGGSGVSITTGGSGTGNNTFNAPLVFNEMVTGTVNQTTSTSGAGSLNLVSAISGNGGFTKLGDGLATFGTGAKTYTGATVLGDVNGVLGGGRMRISQAAQPSATSSFTIYAGAQLDFITVGGAYSFGSGNLNLNGAGPTTGPFAAFPGAIRQDTGLLTSIANNTVLQSNTTLHVQATAGTGGNATPTGQMTMNGIISGPGKLTLTAPNSNVDQGLLILTNANTYSGGTLVQGGIVDVNGANATLGTGNVTVDNTGSPSSIARLQIEANVLNAFASTSILSLLGGGTAGVADQNYAIVNSNQTVGGLVLGGVPQAPGTYGSSTSGATFQFNEYFSGNGIVTVTGVPEPGTMALAGFAGAGLALKLIRRRKKV
jgi:autotransporter-associated beta strand protein